MEPRNETIPNQAPLAPDKLALSAQEVGEVLGISRAHVWKLASSGRLPKPIRLGRAVRRAGRDLEEWLAAGAPPRDRWETIRSNGAYDQSATGR